MQNRQLNIIFGVLVAILVILQVRSILFPKSNQVFAPPVDMLSVSGIEPPESPPVLSIEDIKKNMGFGEANISETKPVSLPEVYASHPREDTGNNIVEAWARVSPEEKAKVSEELDKQVEQAKEELKVNPDNKSAKHILFISETMKKLCKSNFDYKLLESVPGDEGGLKKKGK